jgi:hypothetical protein
MIEKITEMLNAEWTGKHFVYRSKYGGETIGEIDSVSVSNSFTWDPKSNENFQKIISFKKHGKTPLIETVPVEEQYTGIRPTVSIRSTTGVHYKLEEIYVIVKETATIPFT